MASLRLSARRTVESGGSISELRAYDGRLFWLAREGTRQILRILDHPGANARSVALPGDFKIGSRLYGYGGGSYAIEKNTVYFVNASDQQLFRWDLEMETVEPLLDQKTFRSLPRPAVGDLEISPDGRDLVFVLETSPVPERTSHVLAAVSITDSTLPRPRPVCEGADFYASPRFSPDGKHFCWIEWDNPDMNWDQSRLMCVRRHTDGISDVKQIAGDPGQSVMLPKWLADGSLIFVSDWQNRDETSPENWWNLYRFGPGGVRSLTRDLHEYAEPPWTQGSSDWTALSADTLITKRVKEGDEELVKISLPTEKVERISAPLSSFRELVRLDDNHAALIGSTPTSLPGVYIFRASDGCLFPAEKPAECPLEPPEIVTPTRKIFRNENSSPIFTRFYRPPGTVKAPFPLMVLAHGGPTGRCSGALSLSTQFWLHAGFAVIDVDYRGSTGYGRQFRDALYGSWGDGDVDDVLFAIRETMRQEPVDASRLMMRGKSAGGYLLLQLLLKAPDLIRAASCYYGISDLRVLKDAHFKFEDAYTDRLIGGTSPCPDELYRARSPLSRIHQIKTPLILFHGSDDPVVPVQSTTDLETALRQNNIPVECHIYEGERHGFNDPDVKTDALEKELRFFNRSCPPLQDI